MDDGAAHGRRRRGLRVAGGVVVVLFLAVIAAVVGFDRNLSRVEVDGLGQAPPAAPTPAPTPAPTAAPAATPTNDTVDDPAPTPGVPPEGAADGLTVLVLGSDSREVLTPAEREELGTGTFWGERTEVVALVRLDPATQDLRLLNIPRDTVVTRCDGSRGRINAAYGIGEQDGRGGMSCVVQTVSQWSQLTIDHAVKVDFRGFVDIVDSIGGVELFLDRPLRDRRANLDLPEGCVVLDGADALAFVRARGLDDDLGRIARQQRFLVELRAQIAELGIVTDLPRLLRLTDATARSLQLDRGLTLNRIRQLVVDHRSQLIGGLDAAVVPGTPRISETSGAYLVEADEQRAAELFAWLVTGTDPADSVVVDTGPPPVGAEVLTAAPDAVPDAAPDERPPPAGSTPQRCD